MSNAELRCQKPQQVGWQCQTWQGNAVRMNIKQCIWSLWLRNHCSASRLLPMVPLTVEIACLGEMLMSPAFDIDNLAKCEAQEMMVAKTWRPEDFVTQGLGHERKLCVHGLGVIVSFDPRSTRPQSSAPLHLQDCQQQSPSSSSRHLFHRPPHHA